MTIEREGESESGPNWFLWKNLRVFSFPFFSLSRLSRFVYRIHSQRYPNVVRKQSTVPLLFSPQRNDFSFPRKREILQKKQRIDLILFLNLGLFSIFRNWFVLIMETDECVSSTGSIQNDEIHRNGSYHFSSTKTHGGATAAVVTNIVGPTATAPATSVYELLECPVCTYSMYPPIHQVNLRYSSLFFYVEFGCLICWCLIIDSCSSVMVLIHWVVCLYFVADDTI